METLELAALAWGHVTFNFLASLINGNVSACDDGEGDISFNFLASLINGNGAAEIRI
jgi:hypothetical protein